MKKHNKVIIIGSGPAGYTAALYTARANLEPVLYEGFFSGPAGGQLMTTTEVENYPGFPDGITGPKMMEAFRKQCVRFDTELLQEDVHRLDLSHRPFKVFGKKTIKTGDAIIIATGATAKKLDIPGAGEDEFWQKGVTACAICDGAMPIFRGKTLYVIGGGDSAVEEAIFLTKYGEKVYLVHRRDCLRASKIMAERAMNHPKIEILWNSVITKIDGERVVSSVTIQNVKTKETEIKEAAGVFFAIGHQPNTEFLQGQLKTNNGYLVVKAGSTHTSIDGVFAAGDVQDPIYRQAITAAGSGCMAAIDAERWLTENSG
ncbi:MAG: thioredoxin-disulfide reductase [Chlamydiales bacterium]